MRAIFMIGLVSAVFLTGCAASGEYTKEESDARRASAAKALGTAAKGFGKALSAGGNTRRVQVDVYNHDAE